MAVVVLAPGAAILAGFTGFLACVHAVPSRDFRPVSSGLTNMNRLPTILHELWMEFCHIPSWDIFWLTAGVAMVVALIRERTTRVALFGWLTLAPIACYAATYLFSAWPDYVAHIETSLPRLLIAPAFVAWLFLALSLKPGAMSPAPPAPPPVAQSAPGTDCN
jgi:hypothetical protein